MQNEATTQLQRIMNDVARKRSFTEDQINEIKQAIQNGADITIYDHVEGTINNTILLLAIVYNAEPLAQFIVEQDTKKYSINLKDAGGKTAFNTPLILAIKKGMYDLALKLIQAGADVNEPSGYEGFTPLHFACALLGTHSEPAQNGNLVKLVQELIERGANTTAKNMFGSTPLDLLDHKVTPSDFIIYNLTELYGIVDKLNIPLLQANEFLEKRQTYLNKQFVPCILNSDGTIKYLNQEYANLQKTYPEIFQLYTTVDSYFCKKQNIKNNKMLSGEEKENKLDALDDEYREKISFKMRLPNYSIPEIFRKEQLLRKKTGLDKGELLTTLTQYGIIELPSGGKTYLGHSSGHSDFMSIFAATTWHMSGKDLQKKLIEDRESYRERNPNQFAEIHHLATTSSFIQKK